MNKILIIRFSAMGDVVLTSPVVRCLRKQFPQAEIHFLVKQKFREAIENNPHISKCIVFSEHPKEVFEELKSNQYNLVIDLQRNRKSTWLRSVLKTEAYTFPKLNFQKLLLTTFKINRMPNVHVVDRYFKAVKELGVKNDGLGLDFFLQEENSLFTQNERDVFKTKYIALVLGATYYTKRIPTQKLEEIIALCKSPIVLLGGPGEKKQADELMQKFPSLLNTVGKTSLQQSATYLKYASSVITGDTGLMHIAAAFQKNIVSVWGNTVPDFGMTPYMPQHPERSHISEVKGLSCRPCSKLGHEACPKKHFKCMLAQDTTNIASMLEKGL